MVLSYWAVALVNLKPGYAPACNCWPVSSYPEAHILVPVHATVYENQAHSLFGKGAYL